MLLLVGLGNPGPNYANNRHNIGFMALDRIVQRHGFNQWRARFQGNAAEGYVGKERALALKPATFMNLSGQAVSEAAHFYKIEPQAVVVFYDEIELAPGRIKVKRGGGSAGHNGIRSIDSHIGPDYWRVRLGVGHPGDKSRVHGHVLSDFGKADAEWLETLLETIADQAKELTNDIVRGGDGNRFMTKVMLKTNPPPPKPEKKEKPAEKTETPEES